MCFKDYVNFTIQEGYDLLHTALRYGNVKIAELLISSGADVSNKNKVSTYNSIVDIVCILYLHRCVIVYIHV